MMDGLGQKVDKLMVMIGKLVTKMTDKTDSLNCKFIKPIEVEDKQDAIMNREVFKSGLVR